MSMRVKQYADIRDQMLPGDIVGFSGKGGVSKAVKLFSRPVSHVGIVRHAQMVGEENGRYFNEITESTATQGKGLGVQTERLSRRIDAYDGEIWWLPLAEDIRGELNLPAFWDFLYRQEGKSYDLSGAIKAGLDFLDNVAGLTYESEDFSRLFCSEIVAAALEDGAVLPEVNASEILPMDLCRMAIYQTDYYLLKGERVEIPGYNTIPRKLLPELFPVR